MAYQFDCIVDGCDFRAEGDSEEEVMNEVQEHARNEHPDMDVDEQQIRDNIQQV
ncbi:DUF1059 domain-containing protein [Halomarina halobia]|uniref:DUF1059 domain-containing protein n=1 Tax=Halomarina halobia TaxID=3033386 RepID=A0ABD6AB68_9EURY|nr:DUF1059 domain-containing protein [Halomarina sp. PSR21]